MLEKKKKTIVLLRVVVHNKPKMFNISLVVLNLLRLEYMDWNVSISVAILQLKKTRLYTANRLVLQGQLDLQQEVIYMMGRVLWINVTGDLFTTA